MKKWAVVLLALVLAGVLGGCSVAAAKDKLHDYYVTGEFGAWGDAAGQDAYRMEPTTRGDRRIRGLRRQLRKAQYNYVTEHITISDTGADWLVDYVGAVDDEPTLLQADGNQSLRWFRVLREETDPELWLQSPASGPVKNLSPALLYIPEYAESTALGTDWNDMCVVLKPGCYTVVLALMKDHTWAGGLIQESNVVTTTTTQTREEREATMPTVPVTSNTIPMATARPDPTPTPTALPDGAPGLTPTPVPVATPKPSAAAASPTAAPTPTPVPVATPPNS